MYVGGITGKDLSWGRDQRVPLGANYIVVIQSTVNGSKSDL